MSWVPLSEEERPSYTLLESVSLRALRCGPIPRHVAFIMDGNRRFARAAGIEKIEGHAAGFARLSETLQGRDPYGGGIQDYVQCKSDTNGPRFCPSRIIRSALHIDIELRVAS